MPRGRKTKKQHQIRIPSPPPPPPVCWDTLHEMSDTLARFMNLAPGTWVSRRQAMTCLYDHIGENKIRSQAVRMGLHAPDCIQVDARLADLVSKPVFSLLPETSLLHHLDRHLAPTPNYLLK